MTLSALIKDIRKFQEVYTKQPELFENIELVSFSAAYEDESGATRTLKNQLVFVTKTFHLNYKSQIDCYIIAKYQVRRITKLTIHESI